MHLSVLWVAPAVCFTTLNNITAGIVLAGWLAEGVLGKEAMTMLSACLVPWGATHSKRDKLSLRMSGLARPGNEYHISP